ncbi:MAG: PAQR family membrane homeostasis protein TrhA [Gaiellaceae bacterium]
MATDSSTTPVPVRPYLRGVFHLYACLAFAGLGVALVASAPGPRERLAAAVFGGCLVLTFGISALYHRVTWSPTRLMLMRSADHAAIYLLIAGTYTPYGLLVLTDGWRFSVLGVVWTGAALAIAQRLVWRAAPEWLPAAAATGLGWVGIVAFPQIAAGTGLLGTSLILVGGLLYTLGAVVYLLRRPDPVPSVFGYHELFHVFTIVAAACQYAAVAFFVLR